MSSFVFEGIIIAQGETQSGQSQDGKKWMKVLYTIQEDQDTLEYIEDNDLMAMCDAVQ